MKLIFGVDGGQTSTKCVLTDADGRVLGRGAGGPLTHLAAHGSRERHEQAMRDAFADAFRDAGLAPQPIEAIGLGLTGVSGPRTREADVVREYLRDVIDARVAVVDSDAYTALLGAHEGGAGIIAIAGTGSNVMGMNARGELAQAGGWGWLIGDEGSAMRIGREAVLAAVHAWDDVGPQTMLLDALRDHLRVHDHSGLKGVVYASDFGAKGFAALAALASDCASKGDRVARAIIVSNAADLARQVDSVARRLGAVPEGDVILPVAPVGGAFTHVHGLRAGFETALRDFGTRCTVTDARLPPMFGAAIMARRAAGLSD